MRTPLKGESSTAGQLPSDAPTLFDLPEKNTFKKEADRTYAGSAMTSSGPRSYSETSGQPLLEVGSVVGRRYEVIALLGEGGMGAVYEAKDLELNRTIALKTIRREFGGNPAIIERFKQELILSTQVTHRNVVRIFDLGEAEGMKFITMEYIQGIDLRTMIHERGKIPPNEVVEIIIQVCRALDAAHSVGVIHRDLKPQNIMQDQNGRILVMDFGLARTLEGDGMTMSGALVGTMEYMSPEQALSKSLDQRSDIYSLGLIFYELLSGEAPFQADTALASLIRRTQEKPVPVSQYVPDISGPLDMIVSRCLEREVELRYSSAAELLADLEMWQQKGVVSAPPIQTVPKKKALPAKRWQMWGGLAAALVVGAGTYIDLSWKSSKPAAKGPVAAVEGKALAIMPFRNASGDEKDDWIGSSLADMLSTDIGQSAHLRTVSTDRLHQVLSDLNIGPQTTIGPDTVRRVAEFSNADVVVSGQYARFGDQIVIDATIRDMKSDQSVAVKAQALAKDLPVAIDSLADSVRKNLSLSSDVLQELKSQSFKPNSGSVEALRSYNEGLALMREGKNLDAYKSLQAATKLDPQFALAFSRLGEVQSELGFEGDAEGSSRRAVELASSEDLPLPEKYLITASRARIIKDNKQAIDAYQNLAKSWPSDVDVQYNLGTLYVGAGDYTKARDVFAKILETDPKNIKALWEMGVVENILGNPQAALDSLSKGLNLATQVGNQEQQALMLLSTGISYRHLNRPPVVPGFEGGFWAQPTVFVDVDPRMAIARDEIFGPVLSVIRYRDEEDAIAIANDSEFGLAGGVWSRDLERAQSIAARMRTGTVWINDWHFFHDLAPFGGYKQSGIGREMGHFGLAEYTEVKHVHVGVEANPDAKGGHRMLVKRGPSQSYQYEPRTRVLSGPGSLARLYAEVDEMGKRRALVVTDAGVVAAGLLVRLREVLGQRIAAVFDRVTQDSGIAIVDEAVGVARACGADVIVSLGGGSCIDT
ncbi:MAG TPA: aldehyde dehydrogenase family protein, partial [Edaphobacter sp.]